ncbi:hypothetical protein N788_04420 [Arenimonas donghaensis DSM 18148 = HO3-R19]|uniref:Uncharacterized protein n=1 Tax=Arenimonas donghaensis DSM 18148 = HO3-R19 TaxID=1121014 RepID=A0A087MJ15_9GAMM|nr:hypothetical protein N788_04420 [Arenimonas donghaensis DSM 18148 = HO3-R19]
MSATLLLAACASSGSAGLAGKSTISNDETYMEAVEAAAKPAGVRVVWVNPPKQRKDD